jgi:hypothetical protein
VSLNEQRQVKHTQSTGLKSLSLSKNEEVGAPLLFHKCEDGKQFCVIIVLNWFQYAFLNCLESSA